MKRKTISLIINSIIFISSFYLVIGNTFFNVLVRGEAFTGIVYLRYFTNLSGLFAGIIALIIFIYNFKKDNPKWLIKLHLVASSAELVTFFTVVFFLAPLAKGGYHTMFIEDMFHFHFLNCILSAISFMVLNKEYEMKIIDTIIGSSAALIYSLFYIPFAIVDVNNDFYGFTFGGKYELVPIVIILMYGLSFLCSLLLSKIHNKNAIIK